MPEKISEPKLPRGLARLAFRLPIWLYRFHLGWLLGYRFVLLTHTGRKSGLPRYTVLEVVRYEKITGACIVASGWNTKSDWFHNVMTNPIIVIQICNKRSAATAKRLSPVTGDKNYWITPAGIRWLCANWRSLWATGWMERRMIFSPWVG